MLLQILVTSVTCLPFVRSDKIWDLCYIMYPIQKRIQMETIYDGEDKIIKYIYDGALS